MIKKQSTILAAVLCSTVFAFSAVATEHEAKMPAHNTTETEGVSDATHKELKEYHQKKKDLKESLSPEAKDTLKKRHEKRKHNRHEKMKDKAQDKAKEKHHEKKEKHHDKKEKMKEEHNNSSY